ncbi:MFS transporter [Mycolicibacterium goodii]|uniref:MFS transporter n=2 Tax=Mycolicibacterium goodii TaxID=134601 RepID=A0A0K0XFP1_MYCGD|nr:MFS transporter [Mycolicibacterium goodii]
MWRFMPVIGLCYIVLYLDRQNIGIAALTMNDDLGISASAFGFAAGVYFWSYTILEPPSNFILTKVGARRWIFRIMVTWGLVTIATGFVEGATSLTIARILLGVAEAGFSPGMLYFVSRWFPAAQRGMAMSWIVTFICLSSLGTPISAHLLALDGLLGLAGWRWVFIVTGIPAIIMGYAVLRTLRENPAEAEFLDDQERCWLTARLTEDAAAPTDPHSTRAFLRGLLHPQVLVLVVVWICFTFSLNGFQLWLPQILKQFGLSNNEVGWVASLPALAAIGPMLWWVRHSDRTAERGMHFAGAAACAAVGFGIAAVCYNTPALSVAGFCIAGIGLYAAMAVFITMPASLLAGATLAAGFGVINGMGNLGGYFGPQVTGWIKDATGSFVPAIGVYAAVMVVAGLIVVLLKRSVDHHSRNDLASADTQH